MSPTKTETTKRITEANGWVVVGPEGIKNINDVAASPIAAWNNVCDTKQGQLDFARKGWKAVPIKVVICGNEERG